MQGIVWSGTTDTNDFGSIPNEVFETAYVYFKKSDGSLLDVTNPRVSILKDGTAQEVKTIATVLSPKVYALSRQSQGYYSFIFYTQGMVPGTYDIQFSGDDPAPVPNYGTLVVSGGFLVGLMTREQNLIRSLRQHLMDVDPQLYKIIDNTVNVWKDEALLTYLLSSLSDINSAPTPSSYTLSSFPYDGLIIDGAFSRACRAAAVLETWNTMSYNDEISFVIDRAPKLQQLSQQASQEFSAKLDKFKTWWSLYGDDGAGTGQWMGENKVPFQISRVLSWMPNMRNVFGL